MRLLRVGDPGGERPAVLADDGGIIDVSEWVTDYDPFFFADGGIDRLRGLMATEGERRPRIDAEGLRIGPCITRPSQILCIGLNYRDHAEEVGVEIPEEPIIFNKAPNTLIGPDDDVRIPPGTVEVDWEVELGVVIGKRARYLKSPNVSPAHIAGYCASNDISERIAQLHRGGQWVKGKSFETFNPLGPWLVTPDEIPRNGFDLHLIVNNEVMQESSTELMIFDVNYVVWYLSQFMVLEPGDLINTGTPAGVGVGRQPPRFLTAGDVMDVTVSGLGRQRQRCVASSEEIAADATSGVR